MTTQTITEALLYQCPDTYDIFYAMHVINKDDRNYTAQAHPEFDFIIKHFKDPKFIGIIDTQIHIYIIGEEEKKKGYHIINIEGFHVDYFVKSRTELSLHIKDQLKQSHFLPNNFYDRIIYFHKDEVYVFNKVTALQKDIFTTTAKWSVGAAAIYDVEFESKIPPKNMTAYDILNEIYAESFAKEEKKNG